MNEQKAEPIEQIRKRFSNEWLLIKVTKHDRNGLPLEGILLFHSPDRKALNEKILQLRREGEKGELMSWFAGPLVPEGWEVVLGVLDTI
ncbi:MAG: hypothetical protein NZ805_07540 [Armatimonadetes bacterium]|nr:hypothetical protein [Armatimonadota bacterium]